MAGDSGSGETNYWPGFVDALSNVVLTLVFVLVIFVFALVMASNKVEEKMRQVVKSKEIERVEAARVQQMQDEIVQLKKQLEQANQDTASVSADQKSKEADAGDQQKAISSHMAETKEIVVQKNETETHEGAINIEEKKKNKLSVVFPETVYKMDQTSVDVLSKALDEVQVAAPQSGILIRSIQGSETYTVAQRLAYYRALEIRNFLISKRGIDAGQIQSVIVKPDATGEGRVEIVFGNQ